MNHQFGIGESCAPSHSEAILAGPALTVNTAARFKSSLIVPGSKWNHMGLMGKTAG